MASRKAVTHRGSRKRKNMKGGRKKRYVCFDDCKKKPRTEWEQCHEDCITKYTMDEEDKLPGEPDVPDVPEVPEEKVVKPGPAGVPRIDPESRSSIEIEYKGGRRKSKGRRTKGRRTKGRKSSKRKSYTRRRTQMRRRRR